MQYIEAFLPLPPGVNNLFPTGRSGKRFKSKAYREWEKAAQEVLRGLGYLPFDGVDTFAWKLHTTFYVKPFKNGKRRRDMDGMYKAIIDLYKTYLGSDDVNLTEQESVLRDAFPQDTEGVIAKAYRVWG